MQPPPEGTPTVQTRWWVDTDETTEGAKATAKGPRPPVGSRFFDIGYEFDQDHAKRRLTDLNLKMLDEGRPEADTWRLIRMVPNEAVSTEHLARLKGRVPLPPGARGVIVDSGRSVRFIITGDPVGERVLEFTLGEESSFDCWIRGEWVREELFRDLEDALHHARPFVERYLGVQPDIDASRRG
jgi:hypothetical protein